MVSDADTNAIAFGRTQIAHTTGETYGQPVQAIICPANVRGIMPASGTFSLRVIAGADIERQIMALAPLELGSAVSTSAGKLENQGIQRLIHAIVTGEPGVASNLADVRLALSAALELVHTERLHSVAVPLLGIGTDASIEQRQQWIEAIVDEVVSHVRRDRSRLDLVVLVSRYPDDQDVLGDALASARSHAWRS